MTSPMDRTAPWRRRITSATRPVQPVWCVAPRPAAVVAVEVLVEHEVVLPVRVVLQPLDPAEAGPAPVRADAGRSRPAGPTGRRRRRRGCSRVPGAGRVLDREVVAEEAVVALEDADHQVVEREPDRAAPVRVAAEHVGGRLGRLVVDRRADALDVEHVGVLAVVGARCARRPYGERNSPRRTASRTAASSRSMPTTPSSSRRCPGSPRSSPARRSFSGSRQPVAVEEARRTACRTACGAAAASARR